MLTIKQYQKTLFSVVTFSLIAVSSLVMVFGYFASKKSTIKTFEQSASIEMRLKKEILLQVVDQVKKTIANLKDLDSDTFFHEGNAKDNSTQLLHHAIKANNNLEQLAYLDAQGRVLTCFCQGDKGLVQKYKQDNLGTYSFVVKQSQTSGVVNLFTKNEKTILSVTSPILSKDNIINGFLLIEVNLTQWVDSFLDSELFEVALANEAGVLQSTKGMNLNRLFELATPNGKNTWAEGYMYKGEDFLTTDQDPIRIYFQSKANLNEITKGMGKIFAFIFAFILPVSLLLSFAFTRAHMLLLKKIMAREDLVIQERKLVEIGGMISYLAHQWKQPINTIGSSLMVIQQELKETKQNALCEKIQNIEFLVQRLDEDIETFRDFYRFSKEEEVFNVQETLEEIRKMLFHQLHSHGVSMIFGEVSGDIFGYKNEWMHAVFSILNNTTEAYAGLPNKSNKTIHIATTKSKEHLTLHIKDEAGGIDKNVQETLFQKYSTTKTNAKGTGLGLYFAKIIIEERFGGTLAFQSNETGTTFSITIKNFN